MKGHIPSDVIDDVRGRINIVDLVSGYVALRKAGRNYIGLCPFHKEKTPSFTVNPDKQIYYCFGCGEGGNAISFYMGIEKASFPEALRRLAEKVGVALPESRSSAGDERKQGQREALRR
ncbi:MAG: DNA primase, partial [Deltaproteobacteria bacterium]|nr:DNA primase [Deltaproteobacteria bacterium]